MTGIGRKLSQIDGSQMAALVGGLCDVESLVVLKDLLNRLGCETLCTEESFPMNAAGTDVRSNYLLNTKISGVEEADLVILIGTNIRFEAPVLNARIRKAYLHNGLRVAVVGQANDLHYQYDHLGDSIKDLEQLANGQHKLAALLEKASRFFAVDFSEKVFLSM